MNKIDKLFANSNKVSIRHVFGGTTIFVFIVILYLLVLADYRLDQLLVISKDAVEQVVTAILSVVASIVAAFTFNYFFQFKSNEKIETLKKISNENCTKAILQDLSAYNGIHCMNYRVDVKLKKHPTNTDLCLLELYYIYQKSEIDKKLNIIVHRLNDGPERYIPSAADECIRNEFVWFNDERDMPHYPNVEDYQFKDLYINNNKIDLNKAIYTRNENVFGCSIYLDDDLIKASLEPDSMIDIQYKVQLPFEKESILSISTDFPTNGATITFDYTQFKDDICVTSMTKVGLKSDHFESSYNEGTVTLRYIGWTLPKDQFVYAWWKK